MAGATEETPLLATGNPGSISNWKQPASSDEIKDVRKKLRVPAAWELVVMNMGMSLGYSVYVLTAWLYCALMKDHIFPNCGAVWTKDSFSFMALLCKACVLAFWSLPLYCCVVVLGIFYRNVLNSWLYYEFASHRLHLDYTNVSFFSAFSVISMIVWGVVGCTMYFFRDLSVVAVLWGVKSTIPYWIPLLSFLGMLYTSWDLELSLISLAKYVEDDLEWSQQHLLQTYLVRDYVAEAAWKKLKIEGKLPKKGTMADLIKVLAEEVSAMQQAGTAAGANPYLLAVLSKSYWVTDLLYYDDLKDERTSGFHSWFTAFMWFVFFCGIFIVYMFSCTVVSVFHAELHSIIGDWAWYFSVEPIVAMGPPSSITSLFLFFKGL
eukprot:gnl/MRDRNA2_/MRDRNA2_115576_c0_seq1.p1 gnl/MRDRNA2_/MRDRNA2_115576_c0~~gnl/MRDRNA2_/MRDRNA2_115576_c0_seq1.p1  ORF type:complete len:377 (-),score=53.29 gnl/MRDRNA2_/MRDRNA2_115576_c0_seq1:6-1136(-)